MPEISAIIKWYYKDLIWSIPSPNKVFLTFDDGPVPEVTEHVLDTLATYGAKATFFCLGKNVEQHPELFSRILREGHAVGNHSYDHPNGWNTKTEAYLSNIKRSESLFVTTLFRPPYGRIRKKQIQALLPTYKIIMWDVLSGDYHPKASPESCIKRVMKQVKPGSIIVFHDSLKARKNVLEALPLILEGLAKKGFEMVAIPYK